MRACDIIGRYGGEEFTLLLPETSLRGALPLAERIRKQIESTDFDGNQQTLKLTVSGGIAAYPEQQPESVDDLLRKADEASTRPKPTGGIASSKPSKGSAERSAQR